MNLSEMETAKLSLSNYKRNYPLERKAAGRANGSKTRRFSSFVRFSARDRSESRALTHSAAELRLMEGKGGLMSSANT